MPETDSCVLLFEVCTAGVGADADAAKDVEAPPDPPPPQPASATNISAEQQAAWIDTARITLDSSPGAPPSGLALCHTAALRSGWGSGAAQWD